jgi:hypothetical protein
MVYTLDHFLDGRKLGSKAVTLRHQLHARYPAGFGSSLILLLIINFTVVYQLSNPRLWILGVALGALVVIHLILNNWLKNKRWIAYYKEGGVAFITALVMGFAPMFLLQKYPVNGWLLTCYWMGLNASNLLLFSWYDEQEDRNEGFHTAVHVSGRTKLRRYILFGLGGLLGFFVWWHEIGRLSLFIMWLVLAFISVRTDLFQNKERYRFWGDAIYLIPGIDLVIRLLVAGSTSGLVMVFFAQ